MAWTTPHTAVADEPLTAAQYNATVVDNLHESGLAKAGQHGSHLVSAGPNQVAFGRMRSNNDTTNRYFTSSTYTSLDDDGNTMGPVVTGSCRQGFVMTMAVESMAGEVLYVGFRVTGDNSPIEPNDADAIKLRGIYSGSHSGNHHASMSQLVPWQGDYIVQPMARGLASTDGFHTCTITTLEF